MQGRVRSVRDYFQVKSWGWKKVRKLADYQREKRKMKHRQPYKTFPLLTSNRLGSNYFFTEIKKKILYKH